MNPDKPIPEHIEIISKLMLGAQQHRAVMIPMFLITGVVSLLLGIGLTFKAGRTADLTTYTITTGSWISSWLLAGGSMFIVAYYLAARQANDEHHPLDTPQLRHVFRSLFPALIFGITVGIGICFYDVRFLPLTASLWIASYGIALLSISLYTTKSARFLGILMLALGIACAFVSLRTVDLIHPIHLANFFICLAFGVFHFIVASGSIFFKKINM